LSKQFVVLMRRQMNKTNTAIGIHVKIAMMLLIKTIIKSLKFQNIGGKSIN
jgi:hypothetical protein